MKCRFCPCRVENSNEIDGYQPDGCFYGDDYLNDYCYEDKDGDYCCDKTKDEIENDIEDYQEYMRYNEYLEHHRLPKNLKIVFSAWKGLEMPNPYKLPTAEVMYKDGTSTAEEGKKYIYCSGNCSECISEKRSCWNLKKGEGVIFAEH